MLRSPDDKWDGINKYFYISTLRIRMFLPHQCQPWDKYKDGFKDLDWERWRTCGKW